ncbi:MAG: RNB domain-containing ribonuclease [Propionibacteriales bacterium]|nr:RNB domain-containing ribonuclease [Propionibacteriales bacterium]
MSQRVLRVREGKDELEGRIRAIQTELKIDVDFPPEVVAEAVAVAKNPKLPDLDRTDIPFLTIDPPGSRDLDQALHIERDGDGFVVHYAIADLTAFIEPGGALDVEAHRRGESLYGADTLIPLHPRELSEGAASLLPDQVRPAYLWTIRVAADGDGTDAKVERALVKSRTQLDYEGAQRAIDDGSADPVLQLLKEVGQLRLHQEAERGGVNLPMPEQVVDCSTTPWRLEYRRLLDVENWNAQISLLTGFGAASMMVYARIGILRTLPPPPPEAVTRLHRTARALGIDWPAEQTYADFIRSLDPQKASHEAMVVASTTLLRGAGYAAFDGEIPAQAEHSALASEYAHVTAPLRRLVDRYGLATCAALSAGEEVPAWVRERLHDLPETMQRSGRQAHAYENAVLDLVEASTLVDRVGQRFAGVVVSAESDDPRSGDAVVREPAIEAKVTGEEPLPVGEDVELVLAEADPETRRVRFTL